jgi:GT2 family glycosyltransferase
MSAPLQYECVICTRNRPDALRMSIPRLLTQTRLPQRVIVADASDDKAAIRAAVEDASAGSPIEVLLIDCERGSSVQRNEGLRLVEAPIVFFPDDDALCDPDYAERILAIYERDHEGLVGGVTGVPRARAPREDGAFEPVRMSAAGRLRQLITTPRSRLERRILHDSLAGVGWELKARWVAPDWLPEVDGQLNAWVRGFRMTFRTDAVRHVGGFDETMRAYATFEDLHAGFAVAESHLIVQANAAKIFHLETPGGRGSGFIRGVTNIANRAYVVACHTDPGSPHRRHTLKYAAYRCTLYGLGSLWSPYHRQSLRGALSALHRLRPLLSAPREHAAPAYVALLRGVGVVYD